MHPATCSSNGMRLGMTVLAVSALTAGCSAKPDVVPGAGPYSGEGSIAVFITHHGSHTGVVVPAAAVYSRIPALGRYFEHAGHIEFNWGDKAFYQADTVTSGLAASAVFRPTDSVIHAVAVNGRASDYFLAAEAERLCVKETELASLAAYIGASFDTGPDGEPRDLGKGIYGKSRFFDAVGDYYLTNTCNTWTAKALKSVGISISTVFQTGSGGVMETLRRVRDNGSSAPAVRCPDPVQRP